MAAIGPGTLLDHYEIISALGSGGMGQVFSARDQRLHRDVAIKILTGSGVEDELLAEARAVSRLHHPNICVVHEVGNAGRVPYLVMELVQGHTLADLPVVWRNAAGIAHLGLQIANALEHAHTNGVLHRDLKPANILVTPEGIPKVVDFGLAKRIKTSGSADVQTLILDDARIGGTVPYMAPEVVLGKTADARSDLWSLGVVLYQLLSGHLPFTGATAYEMTAAILHSPPPALGTDIPGGLRAAVERLLEKEPLRRYQTAGEVKAALGALEFAAPPPQSRLPSRGTLSRRVVVSLGVGAALLVAAGYVASRTEWLATPRETARAIERPAVAVVGFINTDRDETKAWVETALAEMLVEELGATSDIRLIERNEIAEARREGIWSPTSALTDEGARETARRLDADFVVTGSYSAAPTRRDRDVLSVTAHWLNARGNVVDEVTVEGRLDALAGVVEQLGQRLRRHLPARGRRPQSTDTGIVPASASRTQFPETPGATRSYADGLAKLQAGNAVGAREAFEHAIAEAPASAIVRLGLSDAWAELGYSTRAQAEIDAALRARETLSWEEQQAARARFEELANNWGEAAQIHRKLWGLYPDVIDHALRLAEAQRRKGDPKAAMETLSKLREDKSFARDPRLDLAEAAAYRSMGQPADTRTAAIRAAEKAKRIGAITLLARARQFEGTAETDFGNLERAEAAFREALQLHRVAKDARGIAETMVSQAVMIALLRGDMAAARRVFLLSADVFRDIGDNQRLATAYLNLANTFFSERNYQDARKYCEDALALADEIHDLRTSAHVLNNLGAIAFALSDLRDADRHYSRARDLLKKIGDRRTEALAVGNVGDIRFEAGQYAEARKLLEEAIALGDPGSRETLGALLAATDQYEASEKLIRDHLADPRVARSPAQRWSATAALARTLLGRGRTADAITAVAPLVAERAGESAGEPRVASAVARVLSLAGRRDQHRQALKRLLERKDTTLADRFFVAIDLAAVEAESGDRRSAEKRLLAVEREARSKGLLRYVDSARALRVTL